MFKKTFITTAIISTLFATNIYASTCTVTVTKPNGEPHINMRVSGEVAGSLGGMVSAVTTDSNGVAVLYWTRERGLTNVFVDGQSRGKCSKNGSLNIIVN